MSTVLTQVGVKQLPDFLRTVTAASDLVDCSLVNCEIGIVYRYQKGDYETMRSDALRFAKERHFNG